MLQQLATIALAMTLTNAVKIDKYVEMTGRMEIDLHNENKN